MDPQYPEYFTELCSSALKFPINCMHMTTVRRRKEGTCESSKELWRRTESICHSCFSVGKNPLENDRGKQYQKL